MYTEQREQFLWKQVHLNWSTKYRLLNKMEMLLRFLPDPLGGELSVKTRGSYLLHKIQLSPVAPYSWMTCHQKLPFSSGMQENCPFPFICTLRAHGACGNLLWSLLLFFGFFSTLKQYLNYIPEPKQTQQCNCQNYPAISLMSYESAPFTKGKRMHVTFIEPTQRSILLGKSLSLGP